MRVVQMLLIACLSIVPASAQAPTAKCGRPVTIYIAEWCPQCHEAVAFLKANNIAYEKCDIEQDRFVCRAEFRLHKGEAIPLILACGEQRTGFGPNAKMWLWGLPRS